MISSKVLCGFNADGDHNKSTLITSKSKRIKIIENDFETNKSSAEEFFFQPHPFSDLTLVIQDKELYVDKSVLAGSSKVFQTYFQDENIDSIEIFDVTPSEMIELLQFLYPQFRCRINNQNVTILLILAHRFEFKFLSSACRTFILFYLSKFEYIDMYSNDMQLIAQDDGTRLPISSILDLLCIWLKEYFLFDDKYVCEMILKKFSQCYITNILKSTSFEDLDDQIKWRIFQARAKHLEDQSKKY